MKTQNQVRITAENVQHIGECIALSAIKKMMRFAHHPRSLDKLYAGLVEDIYGNRGYNTTFSDGYDLTSEVICFLCHYIGHNLDDLACQNRIGELLTIRFACYRHALRYIEKEYLSGYLLAVRLLFTSIPQVFSSVAFIVVCTLALLGCATLTTHILSTVSAFHFPAKQVDHCVTVLPDFIARHLGSDFSEDLRIHNGRIDLVHYLVTVHICPRMIIKFFSDNFSR